MQRSYQRITCVAVVLMVWSGCGDDEGSAADAGQDAGESPRAGRGGSGGRGGAGGKDDRDAGSSENTRAITLRFKATIGDEAFECGRTYSGQGKNDASITPRDFRFFVEDVKLVTRDGEEVAVALDARPPVQTRDVAIVDFADSPSGCASGGSLTNLTITGRVPEGDYTGVTFTNAVPESLNHQNLATATPPLQDTSTYWGWANGYRFIMAAVATAGPAGSGPADADGGGPQFGQFAVHIGAAGCTGSIASGFTCSRPYRNRVRLEGFDLEKSSIVADLGAVFREVDLTTPLECHSAAPECSAAYAAFGLDTVTGGARTSQSVFRVE